MNNKVLRDGKRASSCFETRRDGCDEAFLGLFGKEGDDRVEDLSIHKSRQERCKGVLTFMKASLSERARRSTKGTNWRSEDRRLSEGRERGKAEGRSRESLQSFS